MCQVNDPLDLTFRTKLCRFFELLNDPFILLMIIGLGIIFAVCRIIIQITRLIGVGSEQEYITYLIAVA